MTIPQVVDAQPDSIVQLHQSKFARNMLELGDLYCFTDPAFQPGKVKFATIQNVGEKYGELNLVLFPEISDKTVGFYQFLNSLPVVQKENLVRMFSFYEKKFETELKKQGLPIELKYIAPAVSALNQNAIGENGTAGIWQLTHFQAVLNGLQVSQLADERFNPELSTRAFTSTMKQNFAIFNSPELAVLGYLYGNAKVKNAISFAGENASLTQILNCLPESAKLFVAAFQATAVFLESNHFIPDVESMAKRSVPDTVKITRQLHFQQVSEVLGVPQKQLEFLNPQYRFSIVPVKGKYSKLTVPDGYWDDFVLWQDSVYNFGDSTLFQMTAQNIEYPPAPGRQYVGEPVKNLQIEGKTKIKYTLQSGDVLGVIAEKYDVNVEDLKYWNNIANERRIQAGKNLDIFVDNEKADYYNGLQSQLKKEAAKPSLPVQFQQSAALAIYQPVDNGKKIEHVVKNGESPFTIAKKYNGITPEDILQWNNIADARKIQVGQKLIIYLK
ncbi:MAG: LysM peptidoglycan-binding domain-containing protein [Bacteroidetes bacterium]|nr:MAG: LysM peptidoglycan-binding domain-containing protein [Bacteroidota bacterium]